ncbi:MAG: P63C domain-containing protein [Candidatus Accumulibacter sp.]|nr:P63C domain-containing protein [Accumulibacter sp.]
MTPEQRKENASKAALAKAALSKLPKATHEGSIRVGEIDIPCAVLPGGQRLLTQSGFMQAIGRSRQAKGRQYYDGDVNLPAFLTAKNLKPFIPTELEVTSSQVEFRLSSGLRAFGYPAELLPKVCDVFLNANDAGALLQSQQHIAAKANVIIRALAHVGIIALVDEATGYQRDRAKDALANILEAYIAKELQPWVRTFDAGFYEGMFRLRNLPYPNGSFRPQYFGKLTNDIVYRRLAPGVLEALKKEGAAAEKKGKLHQHLTAGFGRQELLKHLGSVTTMMRLSDDWPGFMLMLNRICPRRGDTYEMGLEEIDR